VAGRLEDTYNRLFWKQTERVTEVGAAEVKAGPAGARVVAVRASLVVVLGYYHLVMICHPLSKYDSFLLVPESNPMNARVCARTALPGVSARA